MHDKLVDKDGLDKKQADGNDFPVKHVAAGNKQSGGPKGEAKGQDVLATLSVAQESPRTLESAGPNGPSEWGKGGKAFSVGVNSEGSSDLDNPCGYDCETGQMTCKSHKQTKAGEVVDPKCSIR